MKKALFLAGILVATGVWGAVVVEGKAGYNSWPMLQAVGKRLVCAYSCGMKHSIGDGERGTFARHSDDGGKTWSGATAIADTAEYGEVAIGKGLDEDGAMLLWVRCYGGREPHHDLYRTKDGVKWEKAATPKLSPLPMQITDVFHVPTVGMMALWFAGDYGDKATASWGTLTSGDNGKTWVQKTVEDKLLKFDWPTEPSAVYLGGGKILAVARTENGPSQFQLTSCDYGKTWKKERTNIIDIKASTPSLILDAGTGLLSNYYYERGKRNIRRITVKPEEVFGNPMGWPASEVVGRGNEKVPWDAGNANAVAMGGKHYLAYYTGNAPDTKVYVMEAPAGKEPSGAGKGATGAIAETLRAMDLAGDGKVKGIATADELAAAKAEWRKAWIESIGGMPEEPGDLGARTTGVIRGEGYRVEKVAYRSAPGVWVTALVWLPEDAKFAAPYPGAMVYCGHSNDGKACKAYQRLALLLVRRGFAVMMHDPVGQGERGQYWGMKGAEGANCSTEHSSIGARAWAVGWNLQRWMLADSMKAIDYFGARGDVDISKLAVAGQSGGGTMTVFMQALDERVKIAAQSCYTSTFRAVLDSRGLQDLEQFTHGQLRDGVNFAAMLAMGVGRVDLLVNTRLGDYFPVGGARETYGTADALRGRIGAKTELEFFTAPGGHGLGESARLATAEWFEMLVKGKCTLGYAKRGADGRLRVDLAAMAGVSHEVDWGTEEVAATAAASKVAGDGGLAGLEGAKTLYAIIEEEAERMARTRRKLSRGELREAARRRAGIRPLAELPQSAAAGAEYGHEFKWWYLKGLEGWQAEQGASAFAAAGRSRVGALAEAMILRAAAEVKATGRKAVLKARGAECVAAAHAYAAEPELFERVEMEDAPKSWLEMIKDKDARRDSFAVMVWGALKEYDWVDLTGK